MAVSQSEQRSADLTDLSDPPHGLDPDIYLVSVESPHQRRRRFPQRVHRWFRSR
jgi:hypothetical protein